MELFEKTFDKERVAALMTKYGVTHQGSEYKHRLEDWLYVVEREENETEAASKAAAMAAKEIADKKKNEKFTETMERMTTDPEWVKAREVRIAYQQKFAAKLAAV